MANIEHLQMLKQGPFRWNRWRQNNSTTHPDHPDLSGADLTEVFSLEGPYAGYDSRAHLNGANLSEANLSGTFLANAFFMDADFNGANLSEAKLFNADFSRSNFIGANLKEASPIDANFNGADFTGADLRNADLSRSYFYGANFTESKLSGSHLIEAHLFKSNFSGADLSGAKLNRANLVDTDLCNANLTGCSIYGISAWDTKLEGAIQDDLIITPDDQAVITVDNLKIAQFIYLLLNNQEIREVIDTIAKKAVLILGRFTPERKAILDAIKETIRKQNYTPILFDFTKPQSQDLTETVSTLAHLSRFIIADLTDPSCSPYEVGMIAPHNMKPLQPIFQPTETAHHEFAMLKDLQQRYYWVLPTYQYDSLEDLLTSLQDKVIAPAEQKVDEIATRRKTE